MADLDLKLDGIANGLLVEHTDKKKADGSRLLKSVKDEVKLVVDSSPAYRPAN